MKTRSLLVASLLVSPLLILQGCSDDSADSKAQQSKAPATSPADPHQGLSIRLRDNQGRVLEVRAAGGYTYAKVEQNGSTFWIAGNEVELNVGDIVSWGAKKKMQNFTSKALGETFDEIFFVSRMGKNQASTRLVAGGGGGNAVAAHNRNLGKVLSTENAAGYTYIQAETAQGPIWIAVTQTDSIKTGDMISWTNGAPMRNFQSKALGRDFELIYFTNSVEKVDPAAMQAPRPAATGTALQGTVISAEQAAGYSYLEVDTGSGREWVAVPATDIKAGDRVSWSGAAVMTNFTSSSLGRTFDRILFAGSVQKLN